MEFVCRVGTPEGRIHEQVFHASDEEELRGELDKRGLHVFQVRRRGISGLAPRRAAGARRKPLDKDVFLLFNQEMAALLRAGLPLLQALDLLLERQEDPQFRGVLRTSAAASARARTCRRPSPARARCFRASTRLRSRPASAAASSSR